MVRRTVRRIRTFCESAACRTMDKCRHGCVSFHTENDDAKAKFPHRFSKKAKVCAAHAESSAMDPPLTCLSRQPELAMDLKSRPCAMTHPVDPKAADELNRCESASTNCSCVLEFGGLRNSCSLTQYASCDQLEDPCSSEEDDIIDSDFCEEGLVSTPLAESSLECVNFSGDYLLERNIGDIDAFLKDCGVIFPLRCAMSHVNYGIGKKTTIQQVGDEMYMDIETRSGKRHSLTFVLDGSVQTFVDPLFGKKVESKTYWSECGKVLHTESLRVASGRNLPDVRRYMQDANTQHVEFTSPSGLKVVRVLTRQ